ncbi:fatty acid desaturase family protein [Pendulispora albinea]|uniref:Fatty acid desaturase family protein n=1 Tax=Pendulispora albinea TaxID=2741071 RepID=A0ABZ2LNK8_9BACT
MNCNERLTGASQSSDDGGGGRAASGSAGAGVLAGEERRPDDYHGTIADRVPPERIRELSRIDQTRSVLHSAGEWVLIAAAIALCERVGSIWLYPVTVAFLGGRQHALFHLAHEATHYHLFRNRKVNDVFGDVVLAWASFHSIPLYRKRHFGHHRNIGNIDDPHIAETYQRSPTEWRFPKTRGALALWMLRRLTGLTFPRYMRAFVRGFTHAPSRGYIAFKIAYYAAMFGAITALGGWRIWLLYWIVPLATWTPMIRDLRLAAEHFGIDGEEDLIGGKSRTVLPSVLGRIFVCSKGTYFHSEHHDYPSVPFYHLRRLHEEMRDNPRLLPRLHLTMGYGRVLAQLSAASSSPRAEARTGT